MHVMTKRLRLESRGFRCKVALNLSYLLIKFEDEIEREPFLISSIISDQLTSKVKLTSTLGSICSHVAVSGTCNTNAWLLRCDKYYLQHRSADDGTLDCGRRSAEYFGAAD